MRPLRRRDATEALGSCAMGSPLHPMPGKTGTGSVVTEIAGALAGLFFPARCRICDHILDGISRVPVCEACWNRIAPFPGGALCRICGLPGPAELSQYECQLCIEHPPQFSMARGLGEYG